MSADISRAVARLRNFRTRAASQQELIEAGADAVEALIEALDDHEEGVRWSALHCLGVIGDTRAVAPLIAMLEKGDLRDATEAALKQITGESLGQDAGEWKAWVANRPTQQVPALTTPDPSLLVQQAFEGTEAETEQREGSWKITLPVRGDRSQAVRILLGKKDAEGAPVLIAYSECGPADPERFEWALRKNLSLPHGAIGVRDVGGKPTFVMFRTLLCDATTPEELRRVVTSIAQRADSVEKAVADEDKR